MSVALEVKQLVVRLLELTDKGLVVVDSGSDDAEETIHPMQALRMEVSALNQRVGALNLQGGRQQQVDLGREEAEALRAQLAMQVSQLQAQQAQLQQLAGAMQAQAQAMQAQAAADAAVTQRMQAQVASEAATTQRMQAEATANAATTQRMQAEAAANVAATQRMQARSAANAAAQRSETVQLPVRPGELIAAASKGVEKEVSSLLSRGADVNEMDAGGRTHLWWAAFHGHTGVVGLLMQHNASVHTEGYYTPLQVAKGGSHTTVVRLLQAGGATCDAVLLPVGRGQQLVDAATKGDAKEASSLLSRGADVNEADLCGGTPLWWAAYYGHTRVATLLLQHNASVHSARDGSTPLSAARDRGRTAVVRLLEANGARG
ncbi:hypothetical protein FOA52_009927 [Chlamydomonas sp. UWO 241]|nr:hypothetical protein FOA52_009927 [Chlamydomonas sp. UWO 241]